MAPRYVDIGFDLNDGEFYTTPANLRRIADDLEANGRANAWITEYSSDTFSAIFHAADKEQLLNPEFETDDEDEA